MSHFLGKSPKRLRIACPTPSDSQLSHFLDSTESRSESPQYNTDKQVIFIIKFLKLFGVKSLCDFKTEISVKTLKTQKNFLVSVNEQVAELISLFPKSKIGLSRKNNKIDTEEVAIATLLKCLNILNIGFTKIHKSTCNVVRLVKPNLLYMQYIFNQTMNDIVHNIDIVKDINHEINLDDYVKCETDSKVTISSYINDFSEPVIRTISSNRDVIEPMYIKGEHGKISQVDFFVTNNGDKASILKREVMYKTSYKPSHMPSFKCIKYKIPFGQTVNLDHVIVTNTEQLRNVVAVVMNYGGYSSPAVNGNTLCSLENIGDPKYQKYIEIPITTNDFHLLMNHIKYHDIYIMLCFVELENLTADVFIKKEINPKYIPIPYEQEIRYSNGMHNTFVVRDNMCGMLRSPIFDIPYISPSLTSRETRWDIRDGEYITVSELMHITSKDGKESTMTHREFHEKYCM